MIRRKQTDAKVSVLILCLAPKYILVHSLQPPVCVTAEPRAVGLSHTNTVLPARTGR